MFPDLAGKNVLLLQGPVGPFFRRFAAELGRRGAKVTKVNFNAGDALFYRGGASDGVIAFRGALDAWPAACRAILAERRIDAVFLFGDCRPIHRAAIDAAEAADVPVWVFEEGYLRPDWVTVEQGGVNGYSPMPRDPAIYRRATALDPPASIPVGNTFYHLALYAVLAAIATTLGGFRYPRYRHHRDVNCFRQFGLWLRGAVRKLIYRVRERGVLDRLAGPLAGRYFFLPLQVHCDAQFQHSPFQTTEQLLAEVVAGFAEHAPPDTSLVIKHHPHDRPYRDYTGEIARLGALHRCADRLIYVHDLHLPTLLKGARGVVTMNSTVGTSALYHGTPVKVLGRAIYDVPELTFQGPLAAFLRDPGVVDEALLDGFLRWLRCANQVNGSFYKRVAALGTLAGLEAAAFSPLPAEQRRPPRPAPAGIGDD